jgi:hypothetical protein
VLWDRHTDANGKPTFAALLFGASRAITGHENM